MQNRLKWQIFCGSFKVWLGSSLVTYFFAFSLLTICMFLSATNKHLLYMATDIIEPKPFPQKNYKENNPRITRSRKKVNTGREEKTSWG